MSETVKLHISIQINTAADIDTELTVEQWNALTDAERTQIVDDNWEAMAQSNSGGVEVITDGAVDV